MKHLIDDPGEILHEIIQGGSDLLPLQHGEAEPQYEGQDHGPEGVQQGRYGYAEVGGQGDPRGGFDLGHGLRTHEARKQIGGHEIGA